MVHMLIPLYITKTAVAPSPQLQLYKTAKISLCSECPKKKKRIKERRSREERVLNNLKRHNVKRQQRGGGE